MTGRLSTPQQALYEECLQILASGLQLLPDKPEESVEKTLQVLWHLAAGKPLSVVGAAGQPLVDLQNPGVARLHELIRRRLDGVPLAHLTGRQNFMGLELLASADALVPRVETELLGSAAVALLQAFPSAGAGARVIDVCTGSGNLALAIAAAAANIRVWGADLSVAAVELARRNAGHVGLADRVAFFAGDLLAPFSTPDFHSGVDMIVCNPPYISSGKVDTLAGEIIGHEPRLAFDGGPLGISIVSRLIKEAPALLKPGGWLCIEVGLGQGRGLRQRLSLQKSFDEVRDVVDASGAVRALLARRAPLQPATTPGGVDADYSLVHVDPVEYKIQILERWRDGLFSGGSEEKKFDWYYRRNVAGIPDVFLLRIAGHPVGAGSSGRRQLWRAGERLVARIPFDFVIADAHRTLFPALFVQRKVREAGLADSPLLFTAPNEKSKGVFMRAGYKRIGDIWRQTRVLRAAFYLRRHLPAALSNIIGPVADILRDWSTAARGNRGTHTAWEARADTTFDDLFRQVAAGDSLVGTRDAQFLNWRFAGCPFDSYRFYTWRSRPGGALMGYAACRVCDGHLHADDFLFAPPARSMAAVFWRQLARTAYREGCISLNAHFLGESKVAGTMRQAGMLRRDGQPIFACGGDTLPGGLAGVPWYLTPADFDT